MSKKKVLNERTCLITRQKYLKPDLLRLILDNDKIVVDINQNLKKRGYYIFNSLENYDKMVKTKALHRIFKREVDQETYSSLKQYFK